MPPRFLETLTTADRRLRARASLLAAAMMTAASPLAAQECPPWSISGSVASGDGSTLPGLVQLQIDNPAPANLVGNFPPGSITVTGPGTVGNSDNMWTAYASGYFVPPWSGTRHCVRSAEPPSCGTCTGSFDIKLYATQGAIDGTLTVKPKPTTGLAGFDVFIVRKAGGAPVFAQTDAAGHFEFRSINEPGRSNNWGVAVDSPTGGMGSATYYLGADGLRLLRGRPDDLADAGRAAGLRDRRGPAAPARRLPEGGRRGHDRRDLPEGAGDRPGVVELAVQP